jgi:arylformamidase
MPTGLYDATRSISNKLPNWPGDTPVEYGLTASIRNGSSVNLGSVSMSTHTGTHVDAPWHYLENGLRLDEVPLKTWIGTCVVVDASGAPRLLPDLLEGTDLNGATQVLFKTGQPDKWLEFPREYATVDPSLPAFLNRHGIKLFGTDAPSVDALTSKDLPGHKAFGAARVCILEGLALEHVPAGRYEIICLPLKLECADGAPARVILRTLPD